MIATVSPGSSSAENTLNTLRYAQRVKEFSAKRPPAAYRRASGAVAPAQPPRARGAAAEGGLPPGWSEAVDPASGRAYYVGPNRETSWERPPSRP